MNPNKQAILDIRESLLVAQNQPSADHERILRLIEQIDSEIRRDQVCETSELFFGNEYLDLVRIAKLKAAKLHEKHINSPYHQDT